MKLWNHQVRGLGQVASCMSSGIRRLALTAPPGAGKTVCMQEMARWGLPTLILCNRRILFEQLCGTFSHRGIDYGQIASGYAPGIGYDNQVAMIQTMARRWGKAHLPPADLVILDEAHSEAGPRTSKLLEHYVSQGATTVCVTATPVGIGHMADHLICAGVNSELRDCGALVAARQYEPSSIDSELYKGSTKGIMQLKDEVKEVVLKVVIGNVLEHYHKLNPDQRPAILYAPGVSESRWMTDCFMAQGIPWSHIDSDKIVLNGEEMPATTANRARLLEASRTGETKGISNRFILREAVDCLDDKTEVLTAGGWKGIADGIRPGELVWSLNKDAGRAELVPCDHVMSRPLREGEGMVVAKGLQVDVRVSEGHRVHFKSHDPVTRRQSKVWRTKTAGELADNPVGCISLPLCGTADFPGIPLTNDQIRLLGWFMSDGGYDQNYVMIYQSEVKMAYVKRIRSLLNRLGFEFREERREQSKSGFQRKDGKKHHYWRFFIKKRDWLPLQEYLTKDGSPLLRGMTRRQFFVLYRELCRGDGSISDGSGRQPTLGTARKCVADLVSELAVTRGYASRVTKSRSSTSGKDFWYVNIRTAKYICTDRKDARATKVFRENSSGETVWCVTNRNDTLFTRRNGKIIVLGNCPWLYHGILACKFGTFAGYVQAASRILRAHPSISEAVLQDHGANLYAYGSINADHQWELGDTEKTLGEARRKVKDAGEQAEIVCPQCTMVRHTGAICPGCGFSYKGRHRMVIQTDGKLRRVEEVLRKLSLKPETHKNWERVYYMCRNSGKTFNQAAAIYASSYGEVPNSTFPLYPTSGADFTRKVSEVRVEKLTRSKEAYA